MAGLSYRGMTLQTGIMHAIVLFITGCNSSEGSHGMFVAIDETKQKINGKQLFVWSAIDIETKELLAIWASYQRSSFASFVFVRKVLEACTNKPVILVDGS